MIVTRPITTNYGNLDRRLALQHSPGPLKLGQVIDAVVLTNSNNGHVNLRIGNTVLNASTNIAFQQNTHLLLEVVQQHPQLLLRLIPSMASSATMKPLQDAMLTLLPRQIGFAPSLAGLIRNGLMDNSSPEHTQLRSVINALTNAIPGRNNLSNAEGVRQAMLQSGLFLEAMLARSLGRSRTDTSRDIKACLLRIQQGLRQYLRNTGYDVRNHHIPLADLLNTPIPPRNKALPPPQRRVVLTSTPDTDDIDGIIPDLVSRTKGAVARLGLHQIISAENFNNGEYMWQFEVPVKHTDAVEVVSITIEKEQKNRVNEDSDTWVVNLALDLPRLGAVQIRISHFEQGVSTSFWTDSSSTRSVIEGQFEKLRSNLQQHGISTLSLCCQTGSPAGTEPEDTNRSNIDIHI